MGNSNNGRSQVEFQSFDDRNDLFNNGTGIYINEAEIVVANIRARSPRGDEQVYTISVKDLRFLRLKEKSNNQLTYRELKSSFFLFQVLHIIDSVLEPLVPISLRQAEYFVNLDASKLLSKSTLYDLGGHRMRIFHQVSKIEGLCRLLIYYND